VVATVTTVAEAEAAADLGSDGLCVQGPDAGGHRATCHVEDEQESIPLVNLVKAVSLPTDAPIIAAGGVRMGDQVADLLERGAAAVQLGTAFPRSPESGAKPAHKDAPGQRTIHAHRRHPRSLGVLREDGSTTSMANMMATDLRPTDRFTNLTRGVRAFPGEVGIPQSLAVSAGAGFRKARTNGQQRYCATSRNHPRTVRAPSPSAKQPLGTGSCWQRRLWSLSPRHFLRGPRVVTRWSSGQWQQLIPSCLWVSGTSLPVLIGSRLRVQAFNRDQ
jgi:hypothetical protein